jgi:S1-C subfamily serine protease
MHQQHEGNGMTPASPRSRLLAISLVAVLVLGGAAAGIALRPDARQPGGLAAPVSPAARDAIRQAASLSDAFIAIAETVTPAVVRIEVERADPFAELPPLAGRLEDLFGRPAPALPDPIPQIGGGTGFIVSADGYILTNHHVIAGADVIKVTLRDKRTLAAEVVGADPTTDIAVIRIPATGLPALALGDSDAARVGEWVLAVGNPGFEDASTLDFTVTSGIISAKGRPLNILGAELAEADPAAASYAIEDFIQTDAVINPGNSGGPLVDLQGNVIGINTAIASTTGYSQGYGFAIPSNLAQRVMGTCWSTGTSAGRSWASPSPTCPRRTQRCTGSTASPASWWRISRRSRRRGAPAWPATTSSSKSTARPWSGWGSFSASSPCASPATW